MLAVLCITFHHSPSTATARTDITTVTSDGHHLQINSTPVPADVTLSITESTLPPSSNGSGIGNESQGNVFIYLLVG